MVKITKKKRGGGKKKPLLSTSSASFSLVKNYEGQQEEFEEAHKAFVAAFPNLKTYLARVEEIAKAILKAHDLPTTWRRIIPYTNDYDLPIHASYAADILFSIHKVREFIKNGDATHAAYEAIRLGRYIACNDAEVEYGWRKSSGTSEARKKKAAKAKVRRERMKAIAKEKFKWKPGVTLTGVQRRAVNAALMKGYEASDRPTSQDMSKDALILKFRGKKK